ncbi:ATP-dependent nuclease [Burkholderia ubonensis]|uniref:ATP-dependent nuclease n=1 Tax=Burkholderia ubonensis TaxID=101571 RepID=UPI00016A4765|nr:AAA family ATPase [Burkholderia ubonensis]
MPQHRITSIRFSRYKAFHNFSVSVEDFNVLVGPNNAGKSTIIGALRILSEGLRRARAKAPEPVEVTGYVGWAYQISIANLPIAAENIFHEYDDSRPARVEFRVSNGNRLVLHFPSQGTCILIAETTKQPVRQPRHFREAFDVEIGFVPVLGPVEQHEKLFQKEAARLALLTATASRNFRNVWYHYPDGFDEFRDTVQTTWPGMDIQPPEFNGEHLLMFCPEGRRPRELCWTGYGFQVWCQMLTQILKAKHASLLVIDEPDIYLHSDLQRQLVSLLRDLGPDILIATHSTEMIAECEPTSLLAISKDRQSAKRVADIVQIKHLFSALGSNLNPTLTQLAKTKRVLFVEGHDAQILCAFARVLGFSRVANRTDFAVMMMEGFNPARATDLAEGIDAAVGSRVLRSVILDRDYRTQEEIEVVLRRLQQSGFVSHAHDRKEIENYLLNSAAIGRAVDARLTEQAKRTGKQKLQIPDIDAILELALEEARPLVFGQLQARAVDYARETKSGIDNATVMSRVLAELEKKWTTLEGRFALAPGKEVFARLNAELQNTVKVSVSALQVAAAFKPFEIPHDLKELIESIARFSEQAAPD